MSKPLRVELAVVGRHVVMACTGTMPEKWRAVKGRRTICESTNGVGVSSWYSPQVETDTIWLPGETRDHDKHCAYATFKSRKAARAYCETARKAVEAAMEKMYGGAGVVTVCSGYVSDAYWASIVGVKEVRDE